MNDAPAEGGEAGGAPAETGTPSALATGGEQPTPINELIPEKYRVIGEDESFNLEESTRKMAEGYSNLAKKLGTDDLPPDAPENYEINAEAFGEDFDAESFMKDEGTQGFLKRMHAKGMTNAQVQEVLEYGLKEFAPQFAQGQQAMDSDGAIQALQNETWKDPGEFKANMTAANRAYRSLPDAMKQQVDARLGNDPEFIQIMAMFGKEMAEDTPTNEDVPMGEQVQVEQLMLSDAYKDPKHPEHEMVSKRVKKFFESKYPGGAVA